ncbi:hypothetical protein X777_10567 [Ooceraea biroi]|uniref:Uncharacterized protein n=1 Tax=Ooceraea biroi TaxID=2015173 RepID=A0A026W7D5_OOCBI|nr:hypothetical protein X777_10567 [Ooceraea biroi]
MPRRASAITSRCQPWERTRSRRYALAHCQLHLRERRIHYPAPPWITLRGCPCTTNPRQTRPTHTDSRNDRLINGRAVSTSETNTIMATNNAASSNTKEGNVEAEIARARCIANRSKIRISPHQGIGAANETTRVDDIAGESIDIVTGVRG